MRKPEFFFKQLLSEFWKLKDRKGHGENFKRRYFSTIYLKYGIFKKRILKKLFFNETSLNILKQQYQHWIITLNTFRLTKRKSEGSQLASFWYQKGCPSVTSKKSCCQQFCTTQRKKHLHQGDFLNKVGSRSKPIETLMLLLSSEFSKSSLLVNKLI